jgi:hypothetical protein
VPNFEALHLLSPLPPCRASRTFNFETFILGVRDEVLRLPCTNTHSLFRTVLGDLAELATRSWYVLVALIPQHIILISSPHCSLGGHDLYLGYPLGIRTGEGV